MVGVTMPAAGLVAAVALAGLGTPAHGYGWPLQRGYVSPTDVILGHVYGPDCCGPRGRSFEVMPQPQPREQARVDRRRQEWRQQQRRRPGPFADFGYAVDPGMERLVRQQELQLRELRQLMRESQEVYMERQVQEQQRMRQWRQRQMQLRNEALRERMAQVMAAQRAAAAAAAATAEKPAKDSATAPPPAAPTPATTPATPETAAQASQTDAPAGAATTGNPTGSAVAVAGSAPTMGATEIEETERSIAFATPIRGLAPEDVQVMVTDDGFLIIEARGQQEQRSEGRYFSSSFSASQAYRLARDVDLESRTTTFSEAKDRMTIRFAKTAGVGAATASVEAPAPEVPVPEVPAPEASALSTEAATPNAAAQEIQAPKPEAANAEASQARTSETVPPEISAASTQAPTEMPKAVPRPPASDAKAAKGPILEPRVDDGTLPDVDEDNTDGEWENI